MTLLAKKTLKNSILKGPSKTLLRSKNSRLPPNRGFTSTHLPNSLKTLNFSKKKSRISPNMDRKVFTKANLITRSIVGYLK
jgi:hypothetical protein